LEDNPFDVLDVKGVGQLMKMTVDLGRATRPDIKIGICGDKADTAIDSLAITSN